MEISRDDTSAMIDVHHIPRKKKIRYERDHSTVRGADWFSDCATKIDAEVPAREPAVEQTPRSERAGDD